LRPGRTFRGEAHPESAPYRFTVEEEVLKKRAKRQRYTPTQRNKILSAARVGNLTAKDVKKQFGVTPVTYYLWRRKAGLTGTSGRGRAALAVGAVASAPALEKLLRGEVRARIQAALPAIVREEVTGYLNTLLAKAPGRKLRRTA
jgi:transposase-like protein